MLHIRGPGGSSTWGRQPRTGLGACLSPGLTPGKCTALQPVLGQIQTAQFLVAFSIPFLKASAESWKEERLDRRQVQRWRLCELEGGV